MLNALSSKGPVKGEERESEHGEGRDEADVEEERVMWLGGILSNYVRVSERSDVIDMGEWIHLTSIYPMSS